MATELQKGFGPALLRRASPEGKLIAELQERADVNLQIVDVPVSTNQLKALPTTPLLLLPSPGPAAWVDVVQVDTVFVPGSDAGSAPLTSLKSATIHFGLEGPYSLFTMTEAGVGYTGTGLAVNVVRAAGNGDLVASVSGLGVIVYIADGTEVIGGNAAGDAKLHIRLYYRVRNLDL